MDQPPSSSSRWNSVRARANRLRPNRAHFQTVGSRARHPFWWLPDPAVQQEAAYRRIWQNLRSLKEVEDGRAGSQGIRARRIGIGEGGTIVNPKQTDLKNEENRSRNEILAKALAKKAVML